MEKKLRQQGCPLTCPMAIIMKDGKILLGHRHYTSKEWKDISVWTIPGGRCDEGENVEQTLRREIEEELGITNLEILEFIGETEGMQNKERLPLFLCDITEEPKLMEPEKFSEWRWIDTKEYLEEKSFNPSVTELLTSYFEK